eukprot:2435754-Ditylum_brightwellii.AAC.1
MGACKMALLLTISICIPSLVSILEMFWVMMSRLELAFCKDSLLENTVELFFVIKSAMDMISSFFNSLRCLAMLVFKLDIAKKSLSRTVDAVDLLVMQWVSSKGKCL